MPIVSATTNLQIGWWQSLKLEGQELSIPLTRLSGNMCIGVSVYVYVFCNQRCQRCLTSRTSPALHLPQCSPCIKIPPVLQRMHQSSAPCSIHQQLLGSSILKVTGGELSSVIVRQRKEERGKEEVRGKVKYDIMRESGRDGGGDGGVTWGVTMTRDMEKWQNIGNGMGIEMKLGCEKEEERRKKENQREKDRTAVW